MTKSAPSRTTKTPGTAYARALRVLGLRQGSDFTVRGLTLNGKRAYSYVELRTPGARLAVAEHLTDVREIVVAAGWTVGFRAYERGDLAMGGHLHVDDLYWLGEVLRLNAQAGR
ncbi:hypothetical protein K1T35_48470 (plasmid) [Pseudonocardia sp. DSM 110487]|uniref:hypothetical protein n=1 Tax=Pseudonocardia sp. DSM 110487 TaxID=2865833 RepID=UPI001C6A65B2|nr:hypothetical protein [Pseudonocardia sp. DSM 110487]QYN41183.1 hypothetical protein K1T35_48470 [Pseudonocardia sp. DSM 110487]